MSFDSEQLEGFLQRRDLKRAEVLIARRLRGRLDPHERASALIARTRVRLFGGRIDDALNDIDEARGLVPELNDDAAVLELRGDGHFARFELASVGFADRSDTALAREAYQRILSDFTDYENIGWIWYQQGRLALTDNHADMARDYFQRALIAPANVPALTAYCYERMGFIAFYEQRDVQTALSFLNRAVDTYPAVEDRRWLAQVHTLRSRILREMRQHTASLEAAQTAIAIGGRENKIGMADALLTAAETLAEMDGGERDVIAYLQQFRQISRKPLGIDVTWSRAHEMLGDAYFKTGQHSAAVTAYRAALQFNPYHPWEQSLHYRVARSCYQLGDYADAIDALERLFRAAAADSESITDYRIYALLANAHYARHAYPAAVDAYVKAIQLAPPYGAALVTLRKYHRLALDMSAEGVL
ncbi:MAG: tetratricopeptide repeat protein [Chloroflexota bacterium]|nr:tetratricopeptide repeat protein [Chloroflexota bacterium]